LDVIAEAFQYKFQFEYGLIGAEAIFKTGNPLPEETLKICKESDAVLLERLAILLLTIILKLK
jgi:3-isopropylmalate dehydrogenase